VLTALASTEINKCTKYETEMKRGTLPIQSIIKQTWITLGSRQTELRKHLRYMTSS